MRTPKKGRRAVLGSTLAASDAGWVAREETTMDLFEALRDRRSIRAFRPGEVPFDVERSFKDAIRCAPSAGNVQARFFHFVTSPERMRALGACSLQPEIFEHAALVVVGSTDERILPRYGERGRDLYAPQDVATATQNLLLAVHAHGFGAVWIGAFDPAKVRAVLDLPAARKPVVLVPIGRPAETPEPPSRLPDTELFADLR